MTPMAIRCIGGWEVMIWAVRYRWTGDVRTYLQACTRQALRGHTQLREVWILPGSSRGMGHKGQARNAHSLPTRRPLLVLNQFEHRSKK